MLPPTVLVAAAVAASSLRAHAPVETQEDNQDEQHDEHRYSNGDTQYRTLAEAWRRNIAFVAANIYMELSMCGSESVPCKSTKQC